MTWEKIRPGLYALIKVSDRVGFISYLGRSNSKHIWVAIAYGGRTKHFHSLRAAKEELNQKLG